MRRGQPLDTPFRRHRFYRDLALYLSWKSGMSERALAKGFLLSRARVNAILKDYREVGPAIGGSGRG